MSDVKKYTAQEAAIAVLKKAEELLKASKLQKAIHQDEPEKTDEAYEVEAGKGKNKKRVKKQTDPKDNEKEAAEGNNPAPGAEPFNVEKYQAEGQKPGAKMGKAEEAEEPKKDKNQRMKDRLDLIEQKAPSIKKDDAPTTTAGTSAGASISAGFNNATGMSGVKQGISNIGSALGFGKAEEGEKGCSQLARFVTHVATKRGKKA